VYIPCATWVLGCFLIVFCLSTGNREEAFYDFAGRADTAILKNGTELNFDPIQVQGLYPSDATINPNNAPEAFQLNPEPESIYIDANGDAITYELMVQDK
jgi:hypothetical protein